MLYMKSNILSYNSAVEASIEVLTIPMVSNEYDFVLDVPRNHADRVPDRRNFSVNYGNDW
jgi:hypothetical protein